MALLGEAAGGGGSVLLIEGPAGIGKTELLDEAVAACAPRGLACLHAKGGELERDFPFGVVRQLFDPTLARTPPRRLDELFTGAAAHARAVLRPPLRALGEAPVPIGGPDAVLHGLYWLVVNLAEQTPLLVVVDDVHWADAASLQFLAYLARRVADVPVALVLGARTGEGEPSDALRQIAARSRVIELPPLSGAAVARLAADRLGTPVSEAFAAACEHVTAGNPYLLRELLLALSQSGLEAADDAMAQRVREVAPRTVARAVLARVAALSPAAERLARAVALLGRDAELRHAARIAGLGDAEAAAAADALVAATVLSAGRPLDFVHPLVRSAIRAELPPAGSALQHRQAAELLAGDGADPERVAAHLLCVEPAADRWVSDHLRAAAARVLAKGAPDAAVRYLERAVAEPPPTRDRGAVLLALGAAQARLAADEAPATLRAAMAEAPEGVERALAAQVLAEALHMRGESLAAARVLEHAIAQLGRDDGAVRRRLEDELLPLTQSQMAARRHLAGRLADARREAVQQPGTTARSVAGVVAVDLAHTDGQADVAAVLAERVLRNGGPSHDAGEVKVALYMATVALGLSDRASAVRPQLDAAVADAQRRGSLSDVQSALCVRAWILHRQGQLLDAEADARLALDEPHAGGADILRPWKLATLALVLAERHRLDEAEALLSATSLGAYDRDSILYQPFRDARGRLALLRGQVAEALAHLEAEDDWEQRWGVRNPGWTQWRSHAAAAHVALGDPDRARALAAEELARAETFGAPRSRGIALRALGTIEGRAGLDHLRRSVEVLAASEDRLEHARSLYELGAAQRRAGLRVDAQGALRVALDMADRCGAHGLALRVREELHAAGARPRRPRLDGIDALTAQERRVSQMAARGLTNREIAEALFLTKRTIEMHLANAYRKLGISSRAQLAQSLRQTEPTPEADAP